MAAQIESNHRTAAGPSPISKLGFIANLPHEPLIIPNDPPARSLMTFDCPPTRDPAMQCLTRSARVDRWALVAITGLLAFVGLSSGPGLSDHESIVATGAREIRQTGDWLIPRVNGERFVRKPPLPFWLAAAASRVVDSATLTPPVSELSARLPSALAGWLTALLVYALGRTMFGHRTGMLCAIAMACSLGGLVFTHRAEVEMTLTMLVAASFSAFWMATEPGAGAVRRRWLYLFYLAFGLSMLAKAPLPLAVVVLPLAAWWFITVPLLEGRGDTRLAYLVDVRSALFRQLRRLPRLLSPIGIAIFVLVVAPWPLYVYRHVEHVTDLWRLEFVARFTGDMSDSPEPFWYYLPILLLLAMPFSLSLPEALSSPFLKAYERHRRPLVFALTWLIVHFVFVSAGAYKRSHYLATCLPALALLLGPTLERMFFIARAWRRKSVLMATVAIAVTALGAGAVAAIVIHRDMPPLFPLSVAAAAILSVGVAWACHFFYHGYRRFSLAVLLVAVSVGFNLIWHRLGATGVLDRKPVEMAARIKASAIDSGDRVTWAVGRPDQRLAWHLGRPIEPLFTTLELASLRTDRKNVSLDLQLRIAGRISERLSGTKEEYVIIDADKWKAFRNYFNTPARELWRVHDPLDDQHDDWVLVTNAWNQSVLPDAPGAVTTRIDGRSRK